MKRAVYIFAMALLVSACTSSATEEVTQETTAEQAEEEVVIPNRLLTMDIDGMVCKMGCGGTIRAELYSIGGVSNVDFDFEDDRATNVASISFDTELISVDEMVDAISAINDGQFKVGETKSEVIAEPTENSTTEPSASESSTVDVSTSRVEMPNLLDLFSGLFIQ